MAGEDEHTEAIGPEAAETARLSQGEAAKTERLDQGDVTETERLDQGAAPTVPTRRLDAPVEEGEPAIHAGPAHVVLGRYRLERRIGKGGFGVVWRAFDEKLQRDVAVKEIPGTDATDDRRGQSSQRALREAQAAARLNHANVATLYEFGAEGGATYLVSELVRGLGLDELIERGGLSDRDVARIGVAVARGLEHAHQRGVIHRDVKPQNVMVTAGGGSDAKLMDFGVAHLRSGEATLTATGDVLGTVAYMAPEQAEGRRATEAVDTYSLALTLYEAWTGHNPMQGQTPAETARRIGRAVPALGKARPDLPRELTDAIDGALVRDPGQRLPLDDLRAALEGAESQLSDAGSLASTGLIAAARDRPLPLVPDWARRAACGASLGGLCLAGGLALAPDAPVPVPLFALCAGLLTAVLPRLGWLAAATLAVGWLALPGGQDVPGTAFVLACALLPVPLLLLLAGRVWSLPALASLLGLPGVAALYLPAAGSAGHLWRRAALGLLGFWWLALLEIASRRDLLLGPVEGSRGIAFWQGSVERAFDHALVPLVTSPELAFAALWALLALVFPWLVRGRSMVWDLIGATAWAAGMVSAQQELARRLDLGQPHGLVVAGVATVAVVAIAHALRARSA